ncbi:MAG TPA: cell division protein FtsA [Bacteroidales bacterium]|nr:cell division protein FtsA [Bacteroidales bacterium]
MENSSIIAAIDIGTTKIVAIAGRKNSENTFEILGFGTVPSKGIKRGAVLNIEEAIESIKAAVDTAVNASGIKMSEVYVGIAGQHIRSTKSRTTYALPSIDHEIGHADLEFLKNKVLELGLDPGEEILHVIPQTFIVDNEIGIKNPVGMSGRQLEGNYHVVVAQIASVSNIKKCVNRMGLKVNGLVLEPLASSAAVLTGDEKEIGVALVDIGGGTTDVAIFHDGVLMHTAVIPLGGNVITSDIKQAFNILERQAEELKKQYGSAIFDKSQEEIIISIPGLKGRPPKEMSLKDLSVIIKARVEEIIHAVLFQIEVSGVSKKLGAGMVICGGGALLKNIRQLFSHISGYDVRIGYPNEYLSSELVEEINQPQFATSVGLIMRGLELQSGKNSLQKNYDLSKTIENDDNETPQKSKENRKKEKSDNAASRPSLMDKFKNSVSKFFDEDEDKL